MINMKVFLSWSEATSKSLAEAFRDWLPKVIQQIRPYYTPDDTAKGSRWAVEISQELFASRVGILFMTKDNLTAPWIMFEAGALSKNIDKTRVCPMLFGIEPSSLKGPLSQFNGSRFEKCEVHKLIRMLNAELAAEQQLDSQMLDETFEKWWPELDDKVNRIMTSKPVSKAPVRSEGDMLEEILDLTRQSAKTSKETLKEIKERLESKSAQQVGYPWPYAPVNPYAAALASGPSSAASYATTLLSQPATFETCKRCGGAYQKSLLVMDDGYCPQCGRLSI
jgi:hypothetical protein